MKSGIFLLLLLGAGLLAYAGNRPYHRNQTGDPAISLLAATDTVTAWLKSNGTDKGIRTTIINLQLSGKRAQAHDTYTVTFLLPAYLATQSKPVIKGITSFTINKNSFSEDGSPVLIQVPLLLQLNAVDDLPASESIPILLSNDAPTAHLLVITAPSKPAAKKQPPAKTGGPHLDNKLTVINPVISKKSSEPVAIKTVDLIVLRDSTPPVDDTLNLEIDTLSFPFSPLIKSQLPIILPHDRWLNDTTITGDPSNKKVYQKTQLLITNPAIDTLPDDAFAEIRIKGGDNTFHGLRLTEKGMYIPNKPFWVELGANFDVTDGFKANNLYSGIFLYKKDVARIRFSKNGTKNIAILGGVYESKTIGTSISSDSGLVYRDGRSYIPNGQGQYPIFRDTGTLNATITSTNVGLFFSPQLRLTHGASDEDGLHLYVSIWTELLWQTVRTDFDYSKLDTVAGGVTNRTVSSLDSVNKFSAKGQTAKQDFRSHYLGIGFPIYLKEGNANLYINPVLLGITTQKVLPLSNIDVNGNAVLRTTKNWQSFYLVQFRLSEETYGFTFTGEIRGLYGPSNKPFITLALSKKFNLDKIGDYVKSVIKF